MVLKSLKQSKSKSLYKFGAALLLSICTTQYANATDGYFVHGTGIKAKGAGGTEIANPLESLAIGGNPAAATQLGNRLDFGFEAFLPDRSATIHGNAFGADKKYDGNGVSAFLIPEFGFTRQINDKSAFGLAAFGNGLNTSYKTNPFARFGATGTAGVSLEQLVITPTYAYKITDNQSIGASIDLSYQLFSAYGIAPFGGFSTNPTKFTNHGKDGAFGYGLRFGYLWKINQQWNFGAAYKTKTKFDEFKDYAGLFAGQGSFDSPSTIGVGLAYNPNQKLNLAFDIRKINFSEVDSVGNAFANLFSGNYFGSDNGPGFGWKDVTSYKFGANYKISPKLTIRGGYSHSTQPIPESQTLLNILAPATITDQFTAGATYDWKDNLEVTGYILYAPKETVKGKGSIPPGFPPSGFGGGNADISLGETSIGVAFGYKY